jgi:FMN phosphatase YigB (HAD superfamily)
LARLNQTIAISTFPSRLCNGYNKHKSKQTRMIRAVFFDFYSVWTPDRLSYYLACAQLIGPDIYKELTDVTEKYNQGDMSIDDLTSTFRYKLGAKDIGPDSFRLNAGSISPSITDFMRSLHGHFVKVGVLANLGQQEYAILKQFNDANQSIETVASPYSLNLKKPLLDQEVFNKAFTAIGEPAESCLVISGNPAYLAFAKLMGAQTIQFEGLAALQTVLDKLLALDMPTSTKA